MSVRAAAAFVALACVSCNAVLSFEERPPPEPDIETGRVEDDAVITIRSCVTDGCPRSTLHCDAISGQCVECLVSGDCPINLPTCDPILHACFECLAEDDCRIGSTCVTSARRCARSCSKGGGECYPGALCDLYRGVCISCTSNTHCKDHYRRVCEKASGQCVECITDSTCPPSHPRCDPASYRCVSCLTGYDCPTTKPVCEPSRHTCEAA